MATTSETLCVCGQLFEQPKRAQGGGRRTIYCSETCRHRAWEDANADKRKAAGVRYISKPENKTARRNRERFNRYGITVQQFDGLLQRQHLSCAGCLARFDEKNPPCVDHDRSTDRVRGVLCNRCNMALGHVADDPMTLRRLMAYLERDRTKTMVYLAGALKNKRIPEIGNVLRAQDFDVMDEWFTPGEHADTNWQEYERLRGRTYQEALQGRSASNILMFDRSYIDMSDVLVVVMPAGKSAMLEAGYAKGRGKHVVLFLDGEPDRYDVMTRIVDKVVKSESDLLEHLETMRVHEPVFKAKKK